MQNNQRQAWLRVEVRLSHSGTLSPQALGYAGHFIQDTFALADHNVAQIRGYVVYPAQHPHSTVGAAVLEIETLLTIRNLDDFCHTEVELPTARKDKGKRPFLRRSFRNWWQRFRAR